MIQNELHLDEKFKDDPDIGLLKVRMEFIGEAAVVKVRKNMKLKEIYDIIVKAVPDKGKTKKYKIVNGFPRTELDLLSIKTIEELGLYPRAAIFLAEE